MYFVGNSTKLRTMGCPESQPSHYSPNRLMKASTTCLEFLAITVVIFLSIFFYIYGIYIVLPTMMGTFGQTFNGVLGAWIVFNILGNLWACNRTKNWVASLSATELTPPKGEEYKWSRCEPCNMLMPPRSWHCKICNRCVLKRDHHCNFTGCCIGHNNHRYFIWFLFYITFGTGLALIYNFIYTVNYGRLTLIDPIFLNILVVETLLGLDQEEIHRRYFIFVIFYVNVVSFVFAAMKFGYQMWMVRNNTLFCSKSKESYDMGFRKNIHEALGRRGFWTIISPTIKSPLAHNGTQWISKQSV
ncbi:hypothetical protein KR074_006255 [Drosophila pseudoananassae]|nr:hypothetical protein KR074_006255 [Drosophila pseudoananassae]